MYVHIRVLVLVIRKVFTQVRDIFGGVATLFKFILHGRRVEPVPLINDPSSYQSGLLNLTIFSSMKRTFEVNDRTGAQDHHGCSHVTSPRGGSHMYTGENVESTASSGRFVPASTTKDR